MVKRASKKQVAWMGKALALARRGTGTTYPNPCVGAVVVKRGAVIGRGASSIAGGPHAEVLALRQAGAAARGADLYVTLEPCSHHGRTPPCTQSIVAAGIARVFVGVKDPNPAVAGRGLARLKRRGIQVFVGLCNQKAEEVHEHYLFAQTHARPFVTLKAAVSLDGFLATRSGDSKWITGPAARRDAHKLRAAHHAIAVGAETLLLDDPALTVRLAKGSDPRVIVFDPRLRSAVRGQKRPQALREGALVLHAVGVATGRLKRLADWGVETLEVPSVGPAGRPRLDIQAALHALHRLEVRSLMVEGGGRLLGAFVEAECFEELRLYDAPLILKGGRSLFGDSLGRPGATVAGGTRLDRLGTRKLGPDRLTIFRRPRT